ncbi:cytochrome P450 [Aspergillus pseudoustus]|uniref:Cytochrome P450 n=1 Tax=Aspergillus pseudoustus TaxID=1810923 RepID=A0ABR4IX45_9EURO
MVLLTPRFIFLLSFFTLTVVYRLLAYQLPKLRSDNKIIVANGCLLPRKWSSARPLGLDLLVRAYQYDGRQQILISSMPLLKSGTTFEQSLLFNRIIGTVKPRNIEALLSTQFTVKNFKQIKTAVEDLVSNIPENKTVDIQPLFFRLTFKTTLFLLGYLAKRGRLGNLYWLLGGNEFRRACMICHGFIGSAVHDALDRSAALKKPDVGEGTEPYVSIDAIIEETQNPKVLKDQCLNILLAGRETTACCLTWMLRPLVQHPHVLSKLRAEIKDIVGGGPRAPVPTIVEVKRLRYLSLVLKKGKQTYLLHIRRTTTLPTGGGPDGTSPVLVRKGKEFALLEAKHAIVRLLQTFEFIEAVSEGLYKPVGEEGQVLTLVVSSAEGVRSG